MPKQIYYFPDDTEGSPAYKFIQGLNPKDSAMIFHHLELMANTPISEWAHNWKRQIEGKLWEVKKGNYRALYVLDQDCMVILHAIKNKGNKLPKNDKKLAIKRMNEYFA